MKFVECDNILIIEIIGQSKDTWDVELSAFGWRVECFACRSMTRILILRVNMDRAISDTLGEFVRDFKADIVCQVCYSRFFLSFALNLSKFWISLWACVLQLKRDNNEVFWPAWSSSSSLWQHMWDGEPWNQCVDMYSFQGIFPFFLYIFFDTRTTNNWLHFFPS